MLFYYILLTLFIITFFHHLLTIINIYRKKGMMLQNILLKFLPIYMILIYLYITYDNSLLLQQGRYYILMNSFLLWKYLLSLMLSHLCNDPFINIKDMIFFNLLHIISIYLIDNIDQRLTLFFYIHLLYYLYFILYTLYQLKLILKIEIFTIPYNAKTRRKKQ